MDGELISSLITIGSFVIALFVLFFRLQSMQLKSQDLLLDRYDSLRAELRGEMKELRGEMKELRGDQKELRGEMQEHRKEMTAALAEHRKETAAEIAGVHLRISELSHKITGMEGYLGGWFERKPWDISGQPKDSPQEVNKPMR